MSVIPQLPKDIITYAIEMNNSELEQRLIDNFDSIDESKLIDCFKFFGYKQFNIDKIRRIYLNQISNQPHTKGFIIEFICYCIAYIGKPFSFVLEKIELHMKTTLQEFITYLHGSVSQIRFSIAVAYEILNDNHHHPFTDENMISLIMKMFENGLKRGDDALYQFMDYKFHCFERHPDSCYLLGSDELQVTLSKYFEGNTDEGQKYIEETKSAIWVKYDYLVEESIFGK